MRLLPYFWNSLSSDIRSCTSRCAAQAQRTDQKDHMAFGNELRTVMFKSSAGRAAIRNGYAALGATLSFLMAKSNFALRVSSDLSNLPDLAHSSTSPNQCWASYFKM